MISKTSLQAIQALIVLAKLPDSKYVGAVTIAKDIGAAQNYLGKVLQSLCASGILTSQKGSGGGFRLNRDSQKISLFDVVDSVEHIGDTPECFFGLKKCSEVNPCAAHHGWKKVRDDYTRYLKTTTISSLS